MHFVRMMICVQIMYDYKESDTTFGRMYYVMLCTLTVLWNNCIIGNFYDQYEFQYRFFPICRLTEFVFLLSAVIFSRCGIELDLFV